MFFLPGTRKPAAWHSRAKTLWALLAFAGAFACQTPLLAEETADTLPPEAATDGATAPLAAAPSNAPSGELPDEPAAKPAPEAADETGAALPLQEIGAAPSALPPIDLTAVPDDLFARIRNGFAMPNLNDDAVLAEQQWYTNRPDYLRRMVERSARYLHYIVEELEARSMPSELALLPMVESAYNPMAYSRAHASGLWQFIPSTGKHFDLKQNWWIDERRDIVAATSAALDYLQSIYELHGDWFLALASYNWGEGAVARAIRKNQAAGKPTDYLSLNMPAETRSYVPKLQALKNIFSNRAQLALLDLPAVPNRPYFATVTPSENIDVKLAARLAEVPVDEFIALNPAHNRPVIRSNATMVIPAEKLEVFQSNLESHQEEDKPLSNWQTYTLKRGENLAGVAPRFGITLADLKRVNGLHGRLPNTTGLTLLVPVKGSAVDRTLLAQLPQAGNVSAKRDFVIVSKGDTLLGIAASVGMKAAEIKRLNRLQTNRLLVGQRLWLVEGKTGGAAPAQKSAAARKAPAASPARTARYTVKRGDSISAIARRFKVGEQDLLRWNPASRKALRPGQELIIYLAKN